MDWIRKVNPVNHTWQSPFRVNLASVPLVRSFRREDKSTQPRVRLSTNSLDAVS